MKKDFLSFRDLGPDEASELLTVAADLKDRRRRGEERPLLAGRTLALIFSKPSTRTRVSFEVGMAHLGGRALFLTASDLQLGRGETIADTARVLSRYVDGIVIRTFAHREVEEWAAAAPVPVINGLTDLLHPCQVLADCFTLWEHFGRLEGLRVAYVGDGNNVANSWLEAVTLFPLTLRLAVPEGYEPDHTILAGVQAVAPGRVSLLHDPREAVKGAEVVYTDVWASMGQEAEHRERIQRFHGFQVNRSLLEAAAPRAVVLHCLPAHRGEEITDDVLDGAQSLVLPQAENRLHLQKALLARLLAA